MVRKNPYLLIVVILTGVIPIVLTCLQALIDGHSPVYNFQKWFIFSAIGVRLFLAGLRQLCKPTFTLRTIFKIEDDKSTILVQELGLHNVIMGLLGMCVPAMPHLMSLVATIGGLYFGGAGILHFFTEQRSENQTIAMISDFVIAIVACACVLLNLL